MFPDGTAIFKDEFAQDLLVSHCERAVTDEPQSPDLDPVENLWPYGCTNTDTCIE